MPYYETHPYIHNIGSSETIGLVLIILLLLSYVYGIYKFYVKINDLKLKKYNSLSTKEKKAKIVNARARAITLSDQNAIKYSDELINSFQCVTNPIHDHSAEVFCLAHKIIF